VIHQALTDVYWAQKLLRSAALRDGQGKSHYRALVELVRQLWDAVERKKPLAPGPYWTRAIACSSSSRSSSATVGTWSRSAPAPRAAAAASKEIIASHILTASLSYALCPDDMGRPLFRYHGVGRGLLQELPGDGGLHHRCPAPFRSAPPGGCCGCTRARQSWRIAAANRR